MERNVSQIDKYVRVGLSIGLIALGLFLWSSVGIVGLIVPAVIGGILLATVQLNWCPIYAIFGISTCPVQDKS